MRNYALSILIFMFTITCHVAKAVEIHVEDSAISTNRKSAVMESAKTSFCDMAWAQIGNKRHYTDFSFTDIAVTGHGSNMGRASLAQTHYCILEKTKAYMVLHLTTTLIQKE